MHNADIADDTMDDRLVDHSPQLRPVFAGQDLLPSEADFYSALDLIMIKLPRAVSECLARILLGLEKAGHHHGLEVADGGGAGFQADVDLVRVRQHVAERVPPPGLAGLPGQLDQPVPFGPGHAVQLEKGPNVPGLGRLRPVSMRKMVEVDHTRAGQVSDTSPHVSCQIRRLRCLPTPDGGSSVTYASSRRADAVRGSRNAADDLEPGSGVGPAFRLRGVARS